MKITRLGIDLGKNIFHVHGVDRTGQTVVQKGLTRRQLERFVTEAEPCLVGMEACAGAHHWARLLTGLGHDARLMSPQFVKPYVKSNKNDYLDAEAICEAVGRPTMRFVSVKSVEQQDLQHLHRARSQAVAQRTALVNQARGFLLEYGIVIPKGIVHFRRRLPEILEDGDNGLSADIRELLSELRDEVVHLDERARRLSNKLALVARQNPACRQLQTIPGIGPKVATALVAAVGDAGAFRNGREMAAWLGLVPRQYSTGGRTVLLGISKRGDKYLRTLVIHGARSALRVAAKRDDRRSRWALAAEKRRGTNVATVALANKNIRTAWALLTKGTIYCADAT
jgi:transposase